MVYALNERGEIENYGDGPIDRRWQVRRHLAHCRSQHQQALVDEDRSRINAWAARVEAAERLLAKENREWANRTKNNAH